MSRLKFILAVILSAFFSSVVCSQNLVVSTQVVVDTFYDDQFDLQTPDTETGSITYRPLINLAYAEQQYESAIQFGAIYNQFFDSAFENSTNFNVDWQARRMTANSEFSLDAGYTQRLVEDFVELDDISVSANQTVETIGFGADYSYTFSPRNQALFGYSQTIDRLGDSALRASTENVRHDISVQWLRLLSPRSNIGVSATYQLFRPEIDGPAGNQTIDTDTIGLALVGATQLNERWSLSGNIGANQAQLDSPGGLQQEDDAIVGDGDINLVSSLALTFSGLRNDFSINLNSDTTQQLDGVVDDQQSLSITWNHRISELWSSNITSSYFVADRDDRTNIDILAALNWQKSPRWLYRFFYQYQEEDVGFDGGMIGTSGRSNRVLISVQYSFEDINIRL